MGETAVRDTCVILFETHDGNSLAEANFASRHLDSGKGQTSAEGRVNAEYAWHVGPCKHMEDQVREGPLGPVPKPPHQGEALPHETSKDNGMGYWGGR